MKRLLLSATIVASLFFASCKKDRICTCTTTGNGFSTTGEITYTKATKRDARSQCLSKKIVDAQGNTVVSDCKLK